MNPLVQQAIDQGFGPKVTDPATLRRIAATLRRAARTRHLEAVAS